ncbi:class I SAM-dependent methyltransferase [Sporomusa acidovorans]|uniref:Ubiquinone biosynthesis O-methyltransferase, mitochondrial n=1 Tax=Sporomusa acidovorans (strain ATCC 49682 / DSM 3132 / Mol) TaxID=1123286 RepID=A0ABZ3IXV2_SPOA4|nr:class I SAM-dependent methyltransferase [Sporomusa acidovorans]OZC22166.1 release factor glutamine methyltransferase [Sporomusa acidovorans DSM 3132]SDE82314.1 Methyltransferase domain-containing protein [Sporomusa acidovorans]
MNIEYFTAAWKKDLSELQETQQFWNMRADDFNSQHGSNQGGKRRQQVVEFLASRDMLPANAEVLDIGCGPGRYSIEFAHRAQRVTGIDISPKMLEYAGENARRHKLDNILFKLSPWETLNLEEFGWQEKYDLVFASMCPGISSADSLLKMCQASKSACFLSGFVERQDDLRDKLHQEVYGKEPDHRWGRNIYYAVNVLWLSGYYPEITYQDSEFDHVWPLDKAIELYRHQLKRMTKSSQVTGDVDEKIAGFLGRVAVDGIVSEKVQSKIAWLCWKV